MTADLAGFLLARIAEDERLARDAEATWSQVRIHYGTSANTDQRLAREAFVLNINPWRVLRDCEAKRRLIQNELELQGYMRNPDDVLVFLALSYADHPDYDESWRP